jgi:hypothetical protein
MHHALISGHCLLNEAIKHTETDLNLKMFAINSMMCACCLLNTFFYNILYFVVWVIGPGVSQQPDQLKQIRLFVDLTFSSLYIFLPYYVSVEIPPTRGQRRCPELSRPQAGGHWIYHFQARHLYCKYVIDTSCSGYGLHASCFSCLL